MDEAEGKKRIAFWEVKKAGYTLKGNKRGVVRAEDTIKRIKAAMGLNPKSKTKKSSSVVESEERKTIKSKDEGEGEEKGGLI